MFAYRESYFPRKRLLKSWVSKFIRLLCSWKGKNYPIIEISTHSFLIGSIYLQRYFDRINKSNLFIDINKRNEIEPWPHTRKNSFRKKFILKSVVSKKMSEISWRVRLIYTFFKNCSEQQHLRANLLSPLKNHF